MTAHIRAESENNHHRLLKGYRHLLEIFHRLHDIVFLESHRLIVNQIVIAQVSLRPF